MIHTIHIPNWHPTRINQLINVHWAKAYRRKNADLRMLSGYTYTTTKATTKRRVCITIVLGKRTRAGDPDSYWKSLLDALVKLKLLVNDSKNWVELDSIKYERADYNSTIITLEDI